MSTTKPDAKLADVVSVRFDAEELERLKALAEAEGVPLSVLIRRAVVGRAGTSAFVTTGSRNRATTPAVTRAHYRGGQVEIDVPGSPASVDRYCVPSS